MTSIIYAECYIYYPFMLSVVMLSVVVAYNQQESIFSFFLSRSNFFEDLSLKGQTNGYYILFMFDA